MGALAERMPLTALIRNLATLTRVGAIAPMKSAWVCERLNAIGNPLTEDFTRIHPIHVLSALLTYRSGKSVRGSNTWTPVPQVVDALDKAFERSFDTAPQTNQRFYLGIDVSGSMASGEVAGVPGLTPRMAAAAMAGVEQFGNRFSPDVYNLDYASLVMHLSPGGHWWKPVASVFSANYRKARRTVESVLRTPSKISGADALRKLQNSGRRIG